MSELPSREPLGDYRENLIVDVDNPILAFKALRDRYTGESQPFAGMPYLAAPWGEDALTWNVFRWLHVHHHTDVISRCLDMETLDTLLFWGVECQSPGEYQFELGQLIRQVDGVRRGQVTEPDLVLIGSEIVHFVECKLGRAGEPLYEPWGSKEAKRFNDYVRHLNCAGIELFRPAFGQLQAKRFYQLVRNAFYAVMLARRLNRPYAVVTVVLNAENADVSRKYPTPREQLTELSDLVSSSDCQIRCLTWQEIGERIDRHLGECEASARLWRTLEWCR